MALTKSRKRLLIILSVIVMGLLTGLLLINTYLASIIEGRVNVMFERSKSGYHLSLDDVGGNIFFGNIRLKGIHLKPDSSLLQKLKDGRLPSGMIVEADIPLFRITGVGIYNAVVNKQIDIGKVEIKRAKVRVLRGIRAAVPEKDTLPAGQEHKFNVDSIHLEGINGFSLGKIVLERNEFILYDVEKEEEILKNEIEHFEVTDFQVARREDLENVFRVDLMNMKVSLKDEVFVLPGGLYELRMGYLLFTRADSNMVIKDLSLKPLIRDNFEMAKKYKFTQEVFHVDVADIRVYALGLYDLARKDYLHVDSVNVNGLDLEIFKDKRYPFDESKRPKLPHQALKHMEMPIYIHGVNLTNSKLLYQEKEEGSKELMTVKLSDLNARVSFITSVRDSIRTGKPMKINLSAKLMEKPALDVEFVLPLNTRSDTFYFAGSLGPARTNIFNSAALPAIGAKFTGGKINGIQFQGSANAQVSSGSMTMLYEGLEAEVEKKDQESKNKFLSWAANSMLKSSNPGKNGKTRVAVMEFERVMYKGFGNFVWKTLQSGITNTISPVGKHVKEVSQDETNGQQEDSDSKERTKRKKRKKK